MYIYVYIYKKKFFCNSNLEKDCSENYENAHLPRFPTVFLSEAIPKVERLSCVSGRAWRFEGARRGYTRTVFSLAMQGVGEQIELRREIYGSQSRVTSNFFTAYFPSASAVLADEIGLGAGLA